MEPLITLGANGWPLAGIIKNLVSRGARPITVTMRTIPKLKKAGIAKLGILSKVSVVNGMINFDYQKSVNRQLEREEKPQGFKTRPNWFKHTDTPGVVCHRDDPTRLYLQVKVERAINSAYFNTDGRCVNKNEVEPFLYARSVPTHQGVEKFVTVIEISFDNITSLVCDGKTYWNGETLGEFFKTDSFRNSRIVASMAEGENDSNSTYCKDCKCRITAGKCKHGITPPDKRSPEVKAFENFAFGVSRR